MPLKRTVGLQPLPLPFSFVALPCGNQFWYIYHVLLCDVLPPTTEGVKVLDLPCHGLKLSKL
jgi:hypothetical protein